MKILYSKTSLKYLEKTEREITKKIVDGIKKLPGEGDIRKLKGEKVQNVFRLRIGKYRVIFSMEPEEIRIIRIDTRGDIYK